MGNIDKDIAMAYCADDEEIFVEVLEAYLEQGDEYKEKLAAYREAKDWKNYAIIAHAIKSTSMTIGAQELSELAKSHEFAGKADDENTINATYDRFISLYDEVLKEGMALIGA